MTTATQTLSATDRQEIHDLVIEHAWLLDHGRWHEVADLYVEKGTLSLGGHVLNGRTDFQSWADRRAANTARRTHHQCTNIRLHLEGDRRATGTTMLVLHVSEGGGTPFVEFVGEYRDHYTRDDNGRWRFVSRSLHPLAEADSEHNNPTPGVNDA